MDSSFTKNEHVHVYKNWFFVIWYVVSTISFSYKSTNATEETGNVTNRENERGTDLN